MASNDTDLLRSFLAGRDAPCPRCGYNLRDLAVPVCPECRKELTLTVGVRAPEVLWLVVVVAPGVFSGLCAALLLFPITMASLAASPPPWPILAADVFGWTSGLAALLVIRGRQWFLRRPLRRQAAAAAAAWGLHVAAFALLLLLLFFGA